MTDPLDADFDLSTFEFRSFGFGNRTYSVPCSIYVTGPKSCFVPTELTARESLFADEASDWNDVEDDPLQSPSDLLVNQLWSQR